MGGVKKWKYVRGAQKHKICWSVDRHKKYTGDGSMNFFIPPQYLKCNNPKWSFPFFDRPAGSVPSTVLEMATTSIYMILNGLTSNTPQTSSEPMSTPLDQSTLTQVVKTTTTTHVSTTTFPLRLPNDIEEEPSSEECMRNIDDDWLVYLFPVAVSYKKVLTSKYYKPQFYESSYQNVLNLHPLPNDTSS